MKKSVVILIALIYVASIALVGFLGLKAKTHNDIIYLESFEILNEYKVDKNTGNKFIIFYPTEGEKSLRFECKVTPEDTSDKTIIYAIDSECEFASIDKDGLLTFNDDISSPVSVKVYLYANQNPTIKDEVTVYYVP